MAEDCRVPLLKNKYYYEGCPGCKVDQDKELQRGLPIRQLVSVWIVVLCTTLPISSLFPFLYFMVSAIVTFYVVFSYRIKDFHIAKREEDIGSYAGYVGASFMLGRALTSVLWGIVADRYGRKPVIIIGTATVVVFNTLFGLSVNFWMAVITRFLLGSLNGLLGPIKAYSCEIFRDEYQALGLSTVSTAWGIGLIIGPAMGGFLAQETLHMHGDDNISPDASFDALESASCLSKQEGSEGTSKKSLLKNWPLMSSIIVYCVFSLHDMAYTEVLSIPVLTSYPYIAMLSGVTGLILINCASAVKNVLLVCAYSTSTYRSS
ncbi:hypothetical protein LWI28_026113 [Acer negundo]|uniref:Major facilitator superfamily (MFS) profile domain-containing protein n=1 Tax=Acer negundo TaxID=4023 RepID=A0AAD5IAT6_ACENE|nr:hypothetical protein LWI28_026113 [Acer negundo]